MWIDFNPKTVEEDCEQDIMMVIKFVIVFLFEAERNGLIAGVCPMHFSSIVCSGPS